MSTKKSREKRLAQIPEPDLARYHSEWLYEFLKPFSFEQHRALWELYRDREKAGREPRLDEVEAILGISLTDTTPPSDDTAKPCANPETTGDAKAAPEKPNRRSRSRKDGPAVTGGE